MTALMMAAQFGKHATVVALLERGADPNLMDVFRRTALQNACIQPLYNPFYHCYQDVISTLCAWPTVLDKKFCTLNSEDEAIVQEEV